METEYGSYTKNYHLLKPDDKDFYDINHINGNMDIVDDELDKLKQKTILLDEAVVDISGLIGTTTNTGGTTNAGTVMAKLNKSLQNEADISALIGAAANTGGTATVGTVMAKLNKLLSDWTNTRANRIDSIYTNIGTASNTGGTATSGTIMAKLNALLGTVSNGVGIKSVQRGTFNETPNADDKRQYINITISEVNPEKTFIILRGGIAAGYAGSSSCNMGFVTSLSSKQFTYVVGQGVTIYSPVTVSYQVVEFY